MKNLYLNLLAALAFFSLAAAEYPLWLLYQDAPYLAPSQEELERVLATAPGYRGQQNKSATNTFKDNGEYYDSKPGAGSIH